MDKLIKHYVLKYDGLPQCGHSVAWGEENQHRSPVKFYIKIHPVKRIDYRMECTDTGDDDLNNLVANAHQLDKADQDIFTAPSLKYHKINDIHFFQTALLDHYFIVIKFDT